MPFPQLETDLNNMQTLPNQPRSVDGWTPAVIKELFDKAPNDIKAFINDVLIPELEGQNGAGNIGIPESIVGSGTNVRARAEWLYAQIVNAVLGQIPLGSLTDDYLSNAAGQLKSVVSEHLADIASHSESIDRTITVGVGKDFTTIQGAIDSLKKRIDAVITINVDPETYAEDVSVVGFYGGGYILINGNTSALDTTHIVNSFGVSRCTCPIFVIGFKASTTTKSSFLTSQCLFVSFKYCNTIENAPSYYGFVASTSRMTVDTCQASNKNIGIIGNIISEVYSVNNSGTGNTYGISAQSGSTLSKNGTQPSGTTAELANTGGAVR